MPILSKELAFSQLDSIADFPITFDDAWQWVGFSTKDDAKSSILTCGFIENEDLHINVESTTTGIKSYPSESISLTVDCFKIWCGMANTEKGKEVRSWYLQIEKEWRALKNQPKQISLPSTYERAQCVINLLSSLERIGFDLHNPRFNQGIKDLIVEILGLEQPQ